MENRKLVAIGTGAALAISALGGVFALGVHVGQTGGLGSLDVAGSRRSPDSPEFSGSSGPAKGDATIAADTTAATAADSSGAGEAPAPDSPDLVLPANAQAPETDDKPVRLSAGSASTQAPDPLNPATLPLARRSLDDFKHLDEKSFLEMHGMSEDKTYKRSLLRLKQHLIGTRKEKYDAVKWCEKHYAGKKGIGGAPTTENLGCSYWRVLQMAKTDGSRNKSTARKKREKGGMTAAMARVKRTRVRSEADWRVFRGAPYYASMTTLDFKSLLDAKRVVDVAMKSAGDCSTANARAAIVRNLEEYLPDKQAFDLMVRVTETLYTCLPPSSEAFEIVHVRMGLLHLERSNFNDAATHLELALQSESPSEEHRSLFWRGFVESLTKVDGGVIKPHENPYWDKLITQSPLTLHALVADELQGRIPYERIAKRPAARVAMYADGEWDRYNLALFTTGLLIARQEKVALERWSRYLTDNVKPVDFETGLFLALAHLHAGNTRSGILTVFSVVRDFGSDKLTPKVLELLYPLRYHADVIKHSRNVDAALVMSLIRQESSFNLRATSPVGARGLMQIMPATARSLARGKPLNLYDPAQNIQIGTRYLGRLLGAHDDNYVFTLASYNAGPRPVSRWRVRYDERTPLLFSDLIPYPETRNYVSGLLRNMHWYRELLENVAHARESRAHPWTAKDVAPRPNLFGLDANSEPISLAVRSDIIERVEDAMEAAP